MILFPAIDLYEKQAVRLHKGNYDEMQIYSRDPLAVARDFEACGAKAIHMVDLEGARDGGTPNLSVVASVAGETSLFVEVGGGIRSLDVVKTYLDIGVGRVILGTAAVRDEGFLREAVSLYGGKIAVGADVRDGRIAIKGWKELSEYTLEEFLSKMEQIGVKTVICTDISRDGAMRGTNRELYQRLSRETEMNIIASGGVSTLEDVVALRDMELYGAIIGKAYYTGAIDLRQALEVTA